MRGPRHYAPMPCPRRGSQQYARTAYLLSRIQRRERRRRPLTWFFGGLWGLWVAMTWTGPATQDVPEDL